MLDNVNTPILCEQVPRIGNKFSQWLGTTVLKLMERPYGWTQQARTVVCMIERELADGMFICVAIGSQVYNVCVSISKQK